MEGDDYEEFLENILRATLIKDENLHVLGVKICKTHGSGTPRMRSAMSHSQKVRRCLARFRPCSKVLRFTSRKGYSKRNTAVIVRLVSVFPRSEAVYDMHFVPLRTVFLHQGSRTGHRLRPTGHSVLITWMHLQYERYHALGMDGLVMGCSRT